MLLGFDSRTCYQGVFLKEKPKKSGYYYTSYYNKEYDNIYFKPFWWDEFYVLIVILKPKHMVQKDKARIIQENILKETFICENTKPSDPYQMIYRNVEIVKKPPRYYKGGDRIEIKFEVFEHEEFNLYGQVNYTYIKSAGWYRNFANHYNDELFPRYLDDNEMALLILRLG